MEICYFCLGGGSLLRGAAHLRAGIDYEQILVSRLTASVGGRLAYASHTSERVAAAMVTRPRVAKVRCTMLTNNNKGPQRNGTRIQS
jgi:hypothetical protein